MGGLSVNVRRIEMYNPAKKKKDFELFLGISNNAVKYIIQIKQIARKTSQEKRKT